jgi:hypothetical protein
MDGEGIELDDVRVRIQAPALLPYVTVARLPIRLVAKTLGSNATVASQPRP